MGRWRGPPVLLDGLRGLPHLRLQVATPVFWTGILYTHSRYPSSDSDFRFLTGYRCGVLPVRPPTPAVMSLPAPSGTRTCSSSRAWRAVAASFAPSGGWPSWCPACWPWPPSWSWWLAVSARVVHWPGVGQCIVIMMVLCTDKLSVVE